MCYCALDDTGLISTNMPSATCISHVNVEQTLSSLQQDQKKTLSLVTQQYKLPLHVHFSLLSDGPIDTLTNWRQNQPLINP